jgi:hypothetical protein
MEAKNFRGILHRQAFDVLTVDFNRSIAGSVVEATGGVKVPVFQIFNAIVLLKGSEKAAAIVVVGNTATIVNVTSHEHKGIPWNFILFIQENFEHSKTGFKIRIIELIGSVPTKRSEFTTLLNNGMHECESKDKLAPDFRFLAVVEVVLAKVSKGTLEVGFDSAGRLGSHLNRVLESRDGEVGCWHRSEEKTEVRIDIAGFLEVEHNLLEVGHPGLHQMAILQHHPSSVSFRLFNSGGSVDVLSLTEGNSN